MRRSQLDPINEPLCRDEKIPAILDPINEPLCRDEKIPAILKWMKDGIELTARQRSGLSLETEKLPGTSKFYL